MLRTWSLLSGAALCLLLVSCGVNHDLGPFQSQVADGIERACASKFSCTIKLGAYTNFHWDSLYIFPYNTSEGRIARVLGQPLPRWAEFQTHEVFVLEGKIVHREDYNVDVERPLRREVVFAVPTGTDFVKMTPSQELAITVKTVGSDVYYLAEVRSGG
jgi:hypothetical protein